VEKEYSVNPSPITPDIIVVRNSSDRALLVCGREQTTCVDLPLDRQDVRHLLTASSDLTREGLRTAILTQEPVDQDLPLDGVRGLRVVRADRTPGVPCDWEEVPTDLLRTPNVAVQVVRQPRTIYDDAGRGFYVEPSQGSSRCLSVLIEPEDILVLNDDIHPALPPRVQSGCVQESISKLKQWKMRGPQAIVPASGIPIFGDDVRKLLTRCVDYLECLYEQAHAGVVGSRYPWERLMYTIPCSRVWKMPGMGRPMEEVHRSNIRSIVAEILFRTSEYNEPVAA
jgi:hypothetical protein